MTAVRKPAPSNVVNLFKALQAEVPVDRIDQPAEVADIKSLDARFVESLTTFALDNLQQEASGRKAAIDLLAVRMGYKLKVSALKSESPWKAQLVTEGITHVADVQGRSTEYQQHAEELNRTLAASIESRLVQAGWTKGGAQGEAKAVRDAASKRVGYHLRKLVDEKLTADQLVAYGFKWSSLLGDNQTLPKPVKKVEADKVKATGKLSERGKASAEEILKSDGILGLVYWLQGAVEVAITGEYEIPTRATGVWNTISDRWMQVGRRWKVITKPAPSVESTVESKPAPKVTTRKTSKTA